MISQQMPPIRVIETIEPASKFQITPDTVVYDLGQNFAGWVRVQISGDKGDRLTIRFAEEINADGSLNISSNEGARASAAYILKGNGTESYEPRFSFFGFRYVELTSDGAMPAISQVQGRVVHSANAPAGTFSCDNELINKIHRATVWSQKSNMIGYPLDCPQRDERLGWFGDAQVTAEEAMFNFDMALFFRNWLSGIQSNQDKKTGDIPIISPRPYIWDEGVEWSSTYIIITWYHYLYYGDKRVLAEHYESMKIYMTFLAGLSKDHILPQGWIGDWGSLVKGWKEGEPESVPTAFYYYNAIILSKIADVLDITEDSARFKTLADQIKTAYNHRYFDAESGNYTDGSQMANAFPYLLDLVPQEYKAIVLKNLVTDIIDKQNSHLTTGVLGTKYMIDALTLGGRSDVAYKLVNQTGYPSWSDMVEKYTTLCEFWTLKQSHNHVMMGSIDAWFYKVLAGIRLDESRSAFQNIVISPFIAEGLNNAQAALETIRGKVVSKWEKTDDGLVMNIEIPFNCQAEIHFPATDENVIFENNKALKDNPDFTRIAPAVFKVPSGNYRFTVKN
ncbi:MAG: hypothetical protein E4H13_11205 [Calditrichales bacterium]|nr:MAG: hypothetical protein E4H13_11205 [Calditrichales bacterium]